MNMLIRRRKFFLNKKRVKKPIIVAAIVLVVALGVFFSAKMMALGDTPPAQTLTDTAGNVRSNFATNDKAYLSIRSYIDSQANSKISVFENFPSQVRYLSVVSLTDKGGRSYNATVNDLGQNHYRFDLPVIPNQYNCQPNETACTKNATLQGGQYVLSDNYADLKLEIEFIFYGQVELNANFQGCENGPLVRISSASNISYKINGLNVFYKTGDFSASCVNIGEISPVVSKMTYIEKDGMLIRTNTFEAGNLVRVVLEIDEPNDRQSDYKIVDKLPEKISGEIGLILTTPSSTLPEQKVQVSSDHTVTFEGNSEKALFKGRNKIEYQFRI